MEDYKKKYEEALERAKTLHKLACETQYDNTRLAIEELFPELKESEDERIRKGLINTFSVYYKDEPDGEWDGKPVKDIIAWLEKQGEQNPAWSEEDEEMFDAIIADIQFTKKAHAHDDNQVVYEREIDWLKSLKERVGNFDDGYKVGFSAAKYNQWKPSDEQLSALTEVINYAANHQSMHWNNYLYNVLKQLKHQLKKLKGE